MPSNRAGRWSFLFFLVLVSFTDVTAAEPPNVILILCDDLGWGDTGYQGNKIVSTPNLDAMAAHGLVMNRFYAASPVCSPTRGSCLTGRHPYRYGITTANRGHMPSEELTLAEFMQSAGYTTGHFGKWHLGTLTKEIVESNRGGPRGAGHYAPPWLHGFDVCFSTEAKVPTWDPMRKPAGRARNTWWDPVPEGNSKPYGTHYWNQQGQRLTEDLVGDDSRVIMDRALTFMRTAAERQAPFLCVIWLHAPHLPVVAGESYTMRYAGRSKYEQHYFGCITALDDQIGRLRKSLRGWNVSNNTLICFCSDNGPEGQAETAPGSASTLRGRKRDLFEGGIRVPAIFEWPGRIRPGNSDLPAVTSDYMPTIAELLDEELPKDREYDGESLVALFDGTMKTRKHPIGFQHGQQRAWIDGRFKIVRRGQESMLFDLKSDLAERNDLSADRPELAVKMNTALRSWIDRCTQDLLPRQ